MSMSEKITVNNTLEALRRHILVDGYPIVIDLEKSRGCHLIDAQKVAKPTLIFLVSMPAIPLALTILK
jgi:hypothetical protein